MNARCMIGYMIMMFIMILEIQITATNLFVRCSEGLALIRILVGLGAVGNQPEKVSFIVYNFDSTIFSDSLNN